MRTLKTGYYFSVIVGIHLIFWVIDLYFYNGNFVEIKSETLFSGELINEPWNNFHRILGEILSSWVVTVFAFNFLMATRAKWVEKLFGGLDKMYLVHRRSGVVAVVLLLAHFLIVPKDLAEFSVGKPLGFAAMALILLGVVLAASPFF
jgi:predicted ferric reductase